MTELVGQLAAFVTNTVQTLGYPGIFLLMALEDVFPPVPSELILPLAGFLVGQGQFGFIPVVVWSTAGSVAGAVIVYAVGRGVGEDRVRSFLRDRGRYLLLRESDLDRAEGWFDRHGQAAVLLGRLVPGLRSGIALPAGMRRMPLARFVLLTAVGAGAWNTVLVAAGWLLGSQWQRISEYADLLTYAVLAVLVVTVAWFVVRRLRERHSPDTAS